MPDLEQRSRQDSSSHPQDLPLKDPKSSVNVLITSITLRVFRVESLNSECYQFRSFVLGTNESKHLVLVLLLAVGAGTCALGQELVVARQWERPILTIHSAGSEGNKYGFEGGRVLKIKGTYHLFTSEMVGDPHWVKMRWRIGRARTVFIGHGRQRFLSRAATLPEKTRARPCSLPCPFSTPKTSDGTCSTSLIRPSRTHPSSG